MGQYTEKLALAPHYPHGRMGEHKEPVERLEGMKKSVADLRKKLKKAQKEGAEKKASAKTEAAKGILKKISPYAAGAAGASGTIYAGKKIQESAKKKGYQEGFGRGIKAQRLMTQLRRGARAEMALRQAAARSMARRKAQQGGR